LVALSNIRIRNFGLIKIRACRIAPKMWWIHSLVGISHFAKFLKKRPVTVCEMLINLQKCPILHCWWKWKSDPESVSGTDHHQKSIGSSHRPNNNTKFQRHRPITFAVILLTDTQTHIGIKNITSPASLAEVIKHTHSKPACFQNLENQYL